MALSAQAIREKSLALLGQGVKAEVVAASLGVSASRISQFLAEEEFATEVAQLKYTHLASANARDQSYDDLEDKLLVKLGGMVNLLSKPREIVQALAAVNKAQRRGTDGIDHSEGGGQVVSLHLPDKIKQALTITISPITNQVLKVGEKDLVTMGAKQLDRLISEVPVNELTEEFDIG